jgi:hypothetical protein
VVLHFEWGGNTVKEADYYASRKDKLLRDLDGFSRLMRPELEARYGREKAERIHQNTLAEYEEMIPQFPYIGGRRNRLTTNLVQAGYGLALYRVLREHQGTVEEAGEFIHLALERKLQRIPAFLRRLMGWFLLSPWRMRQMRRRAQASQERRYPGDWVWEFVEGDGQTFDVGITYTECGIEKFMRSQGAAELTPYLCNTDYVLFGSLGMGLVRTQTLAWGCDCCDFRIQRKGNIPPAWPPQFVERRCGKEEE